MVRNGRDIYWSYAMTSQAMSIIGAVGFALAFLVGGLPAVGAPPWASLVLGAVNAGIAGYLGKTHPGKKKP